MEFARKIPSHINLTLSLSECCGLTFPSMTDRIFQVLHRNFYSSSLTILSRLPWGCSLPLVFTNIFINGIFITFGHFMNLVLYIILNHPLIRISEIQNSFQLYLSTLERYFEVLGPSLKRFQELSLLFIFLYVTLNFCRQLTSNGTFNIQPETSHQTDEAHHQIPTVGQHQWCLH